MSGTASDEERSQHHCRPDKDFIDGMLLPEVMVVLNTAGSSTQETFYHYCQYFVSSVIPASKREPIILLLDGHASHCNTQALCLATNEQLHLPILFTISHLHLVTTK